MGSERPFRYLLAIGSNRPLSARLPPRAILTEAVSRIGAELGTVMAVAPFITTRPLGPSLRNYANGALLLESDLAPDILLRRLQAIERALGRRRHRRWGDRSLDIDIILWSGGLWRSHALSIPHPAYASRDFVLIPSRHIASDWRDPRSGLCIRHLRHRLARRVMTPKRG
jgi:2-amino-4-hydroxy-6-hydroxymethyldihydropteridine diphosphokinase